MIVARPTAKKGEETFSTQQLKALPRFEQTAAQVKQSIVVFLSELLQLFLPYFHSFSTLATTMEKKRKRKRPMSFKKMDEKHDNAEESRRTFVGDGHVNSTKKNSMIGFMRLLSPER